MKDSVIEWKIVELKEKYCSPDSLYVQWSCEVDCCLGWVDLLFRWGLYYTGHFITEWVQTPSATLSFVLFSSPLRYVHVSKGSHRVTHSQWQTGTLVSHRKKKKNTISGWKGRMYFNSLCCSTELLPVIPGTWTFFETISFGSLISERLPPGYTWGLEQHTMMNDVIVTVWFGWGRIALAKKLFWEYKKSMAWIMLVVSPRGQCWVYNFCKVLYIYIYKVFALLIPLK